jgi:hypothetical protein
MPSLNAARQVFAEMLGQPIEWEQGVKNEDAQRAGEERPPTAASRPVEPEAEPPRSFSELRRRGARWPDFTGCT